MSIQADGPVTKHNAKLILFNKPFGVLSQFTSTIAHPGLEHYLSIPHVYCAGRLDRDSEGLLVLTDNGALQARISQPRFKLTKTYWVQVEGSIAEQALQALRSGVTLKDGATLPAAVQLIHEPDLWPRTPPIRVRKAIPTCWLQMTLREGRNRQVRRMTSAVGHPTLRLVRVKVGPWHLDSLQPGEHRVLQIESRDAIWRRLTHQ